MICVPGNDDEGMRTYLGTHFGGVEVKREAVHVTARGRRLFVTHREQFDVIVGNARWPAHVGDRAHGFALWPNTGVHWAHRLWGGQYWSLSN